MRQARNARIWIAAALVLATFAAGCGDDDAAEPASNDAADTSGSDDSAAPTGGDGADDSMADDGTGESETGSEAGAATETDDVSGDASIASVCPSPIIVQHDWYPDYTHGPIFQLAGPDGEVDGNGYYNAEIEPGVTIQLRAGGPAAGFQPPSSLLYQDPSILIGMVSTDNQLGSSAEAPVVAVVSPISASPVGLMWPADEYDFETLADVGESDATVLVFGGSAFVRWMTGEGFVREEQVDSSFDGSPSRFVVEGDLVQQNFVTNEPWLYENEIEDWGGAPIDYFLMADYGWNPYPGVGSLAVRPEVLEEEADCLEVLVPMIQQAAVDFASDPTEAMQTIAAIGPQMGSSLSLSPGLQDWAAQVMSEKEFFQNGPDGSAGSFDVDRLAQFYESFAPILEAQGVVVSIEPSDLATNQFIDPSITFG